MAVMNVPPYRLTLSSMLTKSSNGRAFAHWRGLSATVYKHSLNIEADRQALNQLRVNRVRLMDDIHYTCQWGQGERWGK